ncbi:MAG: hypothetical protein HY023_05215 [Chloroflexi bacterium]|nr:hypothetical protein [Chloroflexota bacterium]
MRKNDGKRFIPTIVFEDGSFLVEPSSAELAKKLGLKTEARMTYNDFIVIGGGHRDAGVSEDGVIYFLHSHWRLLYASCDICTASLREHA